MEELPSALLMEDMTSIMYQLIHLIPATQNDDPSLKNDWRTSSHLQPAYFTAPSRLVQPINPILSMADFKPLFLFDSSMLIALADSLMI